MLDRRNVIDLGAGAGGWSTGLRASGLRYDSEWGYDISEPAIATARAAGHRRINGSFALVNPKHLVPAWGLIASPPCGGFSSAGLGGGRRDLAMILHTIRRVWDGWNCDPALDRLRDKQSDERTALVLEPLRWAMEMMPTWMAWEQVPAVLPVWQECAVVLRSLGYQVCVDVLSSERYGVPQSRKRAVLIARRIDTMAEDQELSMPVADHSAYNPAKPEWVDHTSNPPVGIGEAFFHAELPCPDDSWVYVGAGVTSQRSAGAKARTTYYPAPTVTGKGTAYWVQHNGTDRQRIRRVTVQELGVIQSFPADYPWQGKDHQQYQQVGDAIPVLLARKIIQAATRGL